MSTFVLVHGAWQSISTWDLITPLLTEQGHQVLTPVLTGLGTDQARLSPAVNLSRHIDDVAAEIMRLAGPVILVGHSYAGMIISGVAESVPAKIRSLAFVDAFIPDDGQSALDLLPPEIVSHFRNIAETTGDGWRLPGGEGHLDLWGLKPGPARDFVRARLCDFTLRCFEEPIRLPANRRAALPTNYVTCIAEDYPARLFFKPFADRARRSGWRITELDSGHDCHVERPAELAAALLAATK